MSGHTPGPWEWVGAEIDSKYCGPPAYGVVMESRVSCGAYCQGGQVELDVSDADARLIVAAPDLLRAAKAAVAALNQPKTYPGDIGNATRWLNDAIAKAEGGTP